MLDVESSGNWRSLANEFGIEKQKSDQFGLRGSGPTGALFSYIQTGKQLRHLTMGQLHGCFVDMKLMKLVHLLEESGFHGEHLLRFTRSRPFKFLYVTMAAFLIMCQRRKDLVS